MADNQPKKLTDDPFIIKALLEACIVHESQAGSPDAMWPVVAEVACQTAAELSLGPAFQNCGPIVAEHGLIAVILQTIKIPVHHAHPELLRMVFILLSNAMNGGGDLADNCRAQCAGLLHSELVQRQLLPDGWLRPLADVAGTYAEIWDQTDHHHPLITVGNGHDPMGPIRDALYRFSSEEDYAIDEID